MRFGKEPPKALPNPGRKPRKLRPSKTNKPLSMPATWSSVLTPQPERLAAALAAPYRETFLSELSSAASDGRVPLFLFSASLPDAEVVEWKSLLQRDFDIEDADSSRAVITALVGGVTPATDSGELAVSIVRAAHVATGAAGVGFITAGQATDWGSTADGISRFAL